MLASLGAVSTFMAGAPLGQTETLYYYINDHLGTPQKMMDETGTVVWEADYKPFGEINVTANYAKNSFRFPGQYFDQESGLHYNYHRYYDPQTGRYLTPDPIGLAGGINLFSYTLQNPINFMDTEGLETIKGPNFTCYSGPPRVVVTTREETREKKIFSIPMLHPENYRPSFGVGSFPNHGVPRPLVGPEISVDWGLWEHTYTEFSIYEITKTVSIYNYICVENSENPCETSDAFRWESEQSEVNETEKLIDQYTKWIHIKLYKAGSNNWTLP
jgi:RHS repeat-associated protein